MLSTPSMVFQGGQDDWFGPMAPAQAAKFTDPLFLSSPDNGSKFKTVIAGTDHQGTNQIFHKNLPGHTRDKYLYF